MNRLIPIVFAIPLLLSGCSEDGKQAKATDKTDNDEVRQKRLETLQKSILQKPDSTGLRFNYIAALDSMREYKAALAELDTLIVNDKGNYALWYKRGDICQRSGDTANAIASFENALKIYPAPEGMLAVANLYAETQNPKALETCKRIDQMKMGTEYDAFTAFFKGIYFARTHQTEKASEQFDISISNSYNFMDAYIEKGCLYFDIGKTKESLEVFEMASKVNNRFADAYYWQGRSLEKLGKRDEAVKRYEKALLFDKNLKEASARMAALQKG